MKRLALVSLSIVVASSAACASRPATVRPARPGTGATTGTTSPAAQPAPSPVWNGPVAPPPRAPAVPPPSPVAATPTPTPTPGGPTPWDARDLTVDQAVAAGRAAGKPVALYLLASWCGFCRRIEAGALTDAAVHAEMQSYYDVRVDVDSPAGRTASRFIKSGVPTIVILDASGNERVSWAGNRPGPDLAAKLRSAR
jgi:hypothetical protein